MAIHGYKGGVISATPPTTSVSGASGVWTVDDALQAGANWPVAPALATNSVRLRSSASAYMSRTPSTASNRKTWTWSGWVKRGALGSVQTLFDSRPTGEFAFGFLSGDTFYVGISSGNLRVTTQVFRDPSAWYHIVVSLDTTQATAANRLLIYVNGTQVTSFSTSADPAQNTEYGINYNQLHTLGRYTTGGYFDGYLTEINFIDGQALTPNYFGATDGATGVWQPATYRGTYGTNGFYLPMNKTVEDYSIDYLVVAGGGGGASNAGAAGGAGGLLTGTTSIVPGASYTVTVGSGGAGASNTSGSQGQNSVFNSLTAIGGGYGGGNSASGGSGGSGGGGAGRSAAGGSGTAGQGYAGGSGGPSGQYGGGGGGGAGAIGGNGSSNGGNGGVGVTSSITGSSIYYAGGGGGGADSGNVAGTGGLGGGGNGGVSGNGTNGTANLGGGAGGADSGSLSGGNGGSGVVILRMLTTNYSGVTTGSPTVTTDGSYTVVKFTSSGSYTA